MQYRSPREIPTYIATGHERLAHLAAFLDTLPPVKLTLSRWFGHGKGCAVGLAVASDPWFHAQGLHLERADSLKDCRPVYHRRADWRAVESFFEIGLEDARQLFQQAGYDGDMRPHPKRVAAKIREYLESSEQAAVPMPGILQSRDPLLAAFSETSGSAAR